MDENNSVINKYIDLFSEMIKKLKENIKLYSIILFGSRGKGTSTEHSDYDILIVADFKKDYFERLYWVSNFTPKLPIDLFCYTSKEFENMFSAYKLTVMDAMEYGIVLFGNEYLESYQERYDDFKKHGLRRGKCVLFPPTY